jgi:hypothetical protein
VGRADRTEEAVGLVIDPGAEEQRLSVARHAVSEPKAPEAVDLDGAAVRPVQPPEPVPGADVVGVDHAVAEVADEKGIAEAAEAGRCLHEAPRGVERAAARQPVKQLTAPRVDVDEAEPGAGDLVRGGRILLGVRHVQLPADVLDVERREAVRQVPVTETALQVDAVEVPVHHDDLVVVEVGRIEQMAAAVHESEREALEDRARNGKLGRRGRPRRVGERPGRDRARLGVEEECRRQVLIPDMHLERCRRVEDRARRRAAGDRDDERCDRDRHAVRRARIDRRHVHAVVGDPERGRGARGEAPRVHQIRVGQHRQTRLV